MMNNSNSSVKAVCRLLAENDNFAVYTHENPDADTVGSCFALVRALRLSGKKAYPVCCDRIPVSLTFLTGGERDFPRKIFRRIFSDIPHKRGCRFTEPAREIYGARKGNAPRA